MQFIKIFKEFQLNLLFEKFLNNFVHQVHYSYSTRQQTTKHDTKLRTRMWERVIDISSSIVGLYFYIDRCNYLSDRVLRVETTARALGHQEESGHCHLYECRRILKRFGENSGGRWDGRTKWGVNEYIREAK